MPNQFRIFVSFLLIVALVSTQASEEEQRKEIEFLRQLNLNELMNVDIMNLQGTLAAKKQQTLANTAAALFVITQEDIRRAGIHSIPEALRMVPGLQVARIEANKWAISARGLNGRFSSKLLVLIDGRSVYSPLRSEMYWEVQNTLIEDIDRIEIVRGPGGALWGANAVNGVINIITKPADKTQGRLFSSELSTHGRWISLHQGDSFLKQQGHYRIYGQYFKQNNFFDPKNDNKLDEWEMSQAGFRVDLAIQTEDQLTIQGDVYKGNISQTVYLTYPEKKHFLETVNVNGFNLLSRWQHRLPDNANMILQVYYDFTQRDERSLGETRHTIDIDLQHQLWLGEKNELIWGIGFRQTRDDLTSSPTVTFEQSQRQDNLLSFFIQNETYLLPDYLRLTLGSKFEHNNYTGFETQPTARLLITPNEQHSFWMALSRAVRTPSRTEENVRISSSGQNTAIQIFGNPDIKSETLLAYELGYRLVPHPKLFLDSTLFFNHYRYLRTIEFKGIQPSTPTTVLLGFDNLMSGDIYGFEVATGWQIKPFWKIIASYSYLKPELHIQSDSTDTQSETQEGDTPNHQFNLRSLIHLSPRWEFDSALYYVDNVPTQGVHRYTRLDLRLNWLASSDLELTLGVRNLLDKQHPEFGDNSGIRASEIEREWYGQLRWQF